MPQNRSRCFSSVSWYLAELGKCQACLTIKSNLPQNPQKLITLSLKYVAASWNHASNNYRPSDSTLFRRRIIHRITCLCTECTFQLNTLWPIHGGVLSTVFKTAFVKQYSWSLVCVCVLGYLLHWHRDYFIFTLWAYFSFKSISQFSDQPERLLHVYHLIWSSVKTYF